MAPWIKESATQTDLRGEAKGPTPRHCPLTSTHTSWMAHVWTHVCACVCAHTHTNERINIILQIKNKCMWWALGWVWCWIWALILTSGQPGRRRVKKTLWPRTRRPGLALSWRRWKGNFYLKWQGREWGCPEAFRRWLSSFCSPFGIILALVLVPQSGH